MKNKNEKNTRSPLRFPGSKSKVIKKLHPFLSIDHDEYREPFVGGGAIFFAKQKASHNWLNDKDENITHLFEVMKTQPYDLCEMVLKTQPTVELWQKYRLEREQIDLYDPLERAFRFLFFNRTNYSGIYNANPIGGIEQKSQYKIFCRWNPEMLCNLILKCSQKLIDTRITNFDFRNVITKEGENVFLMIDPPYYKKGSSLYPVYMTPEEHLQLAELLRESRHSFLLTIDDCPEIREMYSWAQIILPREWHYTINSKKSDNIGKELFITNINIIVP
ncbi:DNA adenine methylase [Paenibacillus silagei]|uniref:site-specific DNA-methyltransferase (adenine-specific) n=1 Tax=Paenibacillus silagei TaxID=1670801 RepID=A0ABS4NV95_9BACL|nr:DNA adenine methylase [Paenibacillus silagei]MBP2113391.1 DNA adenine methylase [Paenibacillus silagei]